MSNEDEVVKKSKKELLFEANLEIEKLKKEVAQEKSYKEMYSRQSAERESLMNEVHDFLDGLPNVMKRKKDDGYSENKLSTRLLSWIASRIPT